MNTAYYIQAVIETPLGIEHQGKWLVKALTREDACRDLIHKLAENGCHVRYHTQIQTRSLKP